MSSPTRYQRWRHPLLNGRLGQAEEQEPDPDPEDPIDYASQDEGGAVQVGIDLGTVAFIQEKTTTTGSAFDVTAVFDDPPTEFNLLIAVIGNRITTSEPTTPTGWTRGPSVVGPTFDGGRLTFFYKIAGPSESSTVTIDSTAPAKELYIAEWQGVGGVPEVLTMDDQAAATNMTVGPLTPTSTAGVLFAGWNQSARSPGFTVSAPFTEEWDVPVDPDGPQVDLASRIVDPFSGSYSAELVSTDSQGWGGFLVAFGVPSGGTVWYPAPAANDGDTGTSAFGNAEGACLRVALVVERLIYRIELDIGQETAGATVYEFYGTDDPTFATTTLLATLSFTATGSFTLDSVEATWVPTASYAYYQLEHVSGGGNEREFYEIRLFSAVGTVGVTDHEQLTGRDAADQHPADAVTVTDTAGWFEGTDGESVLAEIGGKLVGYQAHGTLGATETFDAILGWHSGTLNANLAVTLTANPSGTVSSMILELEQDGTGGWTLDLPASVVNSTDLEAAFDTTAGLTSLLVLMSRDGGSSWFGFFAGGGGSDLTIEDEGTPLATAATTLDFVGPLVTASGATGDKTITVTGDLDDLTDVTITAPAEDDDLRYNGSVWVNDPRKWEVVTDGEDVFVWDGDDLVFEWSV